MTSATIPQAAPGDHRPTGIQPSAWPDIAVAYRSMLGEQKELSEDATISDHMLPALRSELTDKLRPLYQALLSFPVGSMLELSEKAALLTMDMNDADCMANELRVLAADAARLARPEDRTEWQTAVAAYEAARDAYCRPWEPERTDEEAWALWDAFLIGWRDMMETIAPDAHARAYRIAETINLSHLEATGESSNDPATLQRLLNGTLLDGGYEAVTMLREACIQADIPHPSRSLRRTAK